VAALELYTMMCFLFQKPLDLNYRTRLFPLNQQVYFAKQKHVDSFEVYH